MKPKGKILVIPDDGQEMEFDFEDIVGNEENTTILNKFKRRAQTVARRFSRLLEEEETEEETEEVSQEEMRDLMLNVHVRDTVARKLESALCMVEWEPRGEVGKTAPGFYTVFVSRVIVCDTDDEDWNLHVEVVSKYEKADSIKMNLTEFLTSFEPLQEISIKKYDA